MELFQRMQYLEVGCFRTVVLLINGEFRLFYVAIGVLAEDFLPGFVACFLIFTYCFQALSLPLFCCSRPGGIGIEFFQVVLCKILNVFGLVMLDISLLRPEVEERFLFSKKVISDKMCFIRVYSCICRFLYGMNVNYFNECWETFIVLLLKIGLQFCCCI